LARSGEHMGRTLIVVRCVDRASARFSELLRSARIASELARAFPGTETPVGIADSRVVAVVPADDVIEANLVRARQAIGLIDGVELDELTTLELPSEEGDVQAYVAGL